MSSNGVYRHQTLSLLVSMYSRNERFCFRSSKEKVHYCITTLTSTATHIVGDTKLNHLPCNTTMVHLYGSSWPTCKSTRVNERVLNGCQNGSQSIEGMIEEEFLVVYLSSTLLGVCQFALFVHKETSRLHPDSQLLLKK
ncbi:hypothetical protein O9993_07710 [Vibrio lentus]|nr:hypothetical protein [Vibrio lentus]